MNPPTDLHKLRCVVDASMQISEAMASVSFAAGDTRDINDRIMAITAAVEESTAAIEELAHAADESSRFAGDCKLNMRDAQNAFSQTYTSIETVAQEAEDNLRQAKTLETESKEIREIVDIIAHIATQTRMLALNANIEAARAGEAGRGFSVVASEVKNLSQETQSATNRISKTLHAILTQLQSMVTRMDHTRDSARSCCKELENVCSTIDESCAKMDEIASQAGNTAASVSQQSASMAEISNAAEAIAHLAEKSCDNSERALESVSQTEKIVTEQFDELQNVDPDLLVLFRAQSDHFLWKKHLAELLAGRSALNSVELKDCHQCRLGKWYDQAKDDPRFRQNQNFIDLAHPHARVHQLGKQATEHFAQKNREAAHQAYLELDRYSREVAEKLNALIEDIRETASVTQFSIQPPSPLA